MINRAIELLEEFKSLNSIEAIFNVKSGYLWHAREREVKEEILELLRPFFDNTLPWPGLIDTALRYGGPLVSLPDIQGIQDVLGAWLKNDTSVLGINVNGRFWMSIYDPPEYRVVELIPRHRKLQVMKELKEMALWFPDRSEEYLDRRSDLKFGTGNYYKVIDLGPKMKAVYPGKSNDRRAQRRKRKRLNGGT